MNSEKIEIFLARLYTDQKLLQSFLENPAQTLNNQDLGEEEKAAMQNIDRDGLQMASNSYKNKRKKRQSLKTKSNFLQLINKVKEKLKRK